MEVLIVFKGNINVFKGNINALTVSNEPCSGLPVASSQLALQAWCRSMSYI